MIMNIRIANAADFARTYLAAFEEQFLRIQGDYRKRRNAFDHLFRGSKYDPAGSFAYRWECVLRRLDMTDIRPIMEALRRGIHVLGGGQSASPALPASKPEELGRGMTAPDLSSVPPTTYA